MENPRKNEESSLEILKQGREELNNSPEMQLLLDDWEESVRLRGQIKRDLKFARQEGNKKDEEKYLEQFNDIEEKINEIDNKIAAMKDVVRERMVNREK
ncbi:MAG: hypothetical protein ABSA74_02620 [Candidatus Staskawiczbacteria bacterium]|jgi:hypothetical protein